MTKMSSILQAMDDFSAHQARIANQDARMPEPLRAVMSCPRGLDRCPRCNALNGPFERLGSGICNACLQRRVAATKAANTRHAKRQGTRNATRKTGGR